MDQAADFESTRISNPDLAKWISENLIFDQLILEFYEQTRGSDAKYHVMKLTQIADGLHCTLMFLMGVTAVKQ